MQLTTEHLTSRQTVEIQALEDAKKALSEAALTSDYTGMSYQHSQVLRGRGRVEMISYAMVVVKQAEESEAVTAIHARLMNAFSQVMLRGADDEWSGRDNDDKRKIHAAKLEIISEILA